MPVTAYTNVGPHRTVVANATTIRKLVGSHFDKTYGYLTTSINQRLVYEGLIVARNTITYKFVPYSAGATYGTGSDTPVGVLEHRLDVTHFDKATAPIYHGELVEDHCYVYGSNLGVIPAAVKTALSEIHWKPEV